jgi:hypothetical protein
MALTITNKFAALGKSWADDSDDEASSSVATEVPENFTRVVTRKEKKAEKEPVFQTRVWKRHDEYKFTEVVDLAKFVPEDFRGSITIDYGIWKCVSQRFGLDLAFYDQRQNIVHLCSDFSIRPVHEAINYIEYSKDFETLLWDRWNAPK